MPEIDHSTSLTWLTCTTVSSAAIGSDALHVSVAGLVWFKVTALFVWTSLLWNGNVTPDPGVGLSENSILFVSDASL